MQAFDPVLALLGGALIGLAASLFAVFNGRVAGISGILGGVIDGDWGNLAWRAAFLAGLIGAGGASYYLFQPEIKIDADWPLLVLAGLIVGAGSRIGSGCTSGHGVCGLARGSVRSLVSTGIFMACAGITVFVVRHVLGAG